MALTPDQEKLKEAALEICSGEPYRPLEPAYYKALYEFDHLANPAAILAILAQLEQVQGDALKDVADAVHLAWSQACSDAAFYVAGHCHNGESYAEEISTLQMPKFRFRGQEIPPPPEAA